MTQAIGIDIGGTNTRVGLIDAAGGVVDVRRGPTLPGAGGAELIQWIAAAINELAAVHPAATPTAVGVAVPGLLDEARASILRAVNLPFLENVPLRDELAARTGRPIALDTDVAAAAWAEYTVAPHQPRRMVFLVIGTGIGAAVLLDGRLVRHTDSGAGHIGQLIVDSSPDAPRGRCGTAGCLEACAAGPALERAAEAVGLPPSLAELQARCQNGDTAATAVVNTTARFLAIGLVNLVHLYAADEIVIGGGAAGALPELIRRAGAHVRDLGGDLVPRDLVLRAATLGDDAGIIGAALLASQHTEGGVLSRARPG